MVSKYYLTNIAAKDLEDIFDYISIELMNTDSAHELILLFEEKFNDLVLFPESYPIIESKRLLIKGLRKAKVRNYLVIYLVNYEKNSIEIYRVIYQREDYL